MSAIVLVSVLIMTIVFFLGLPHHTQELIASFGFGFGAIVTLTLLFVPKIMVQYHLNSARLSTKFGTVEPLVSSKKKYNNGATVTPAADGTAVGTAIRTATSQLQEAEALLKGKSKQEKLLFCQDKMRLWQGLLMRQQRAALNTNSNSTSSGAGSHSDGVTSSSPIRIEPSMLSSVMEADPEFGAMGDEMFNVGDVNFVGSSTSLYPASLSVTAPDQSLSNGDRHGHIVVEDI
jgi:hypothetical protein